MRTQAMASEKMTGTRDLLAAERFWRDCEINIGAV